MKRFSLVIMVIPFIPLFLLSQGIPDSNLLTDQEELKVFFDCADCDMEYIKTNFSIVNYVNQRQNADVSILVTSLETGSGGLEYTLLLTGYGRFAALTDTIVFSLAGLSTVEEVRSTTLENLQLGLVPFLLKTSSREKLFIIIEEGSSSVTSSEKKDPWRDWIFEVSGMGSVFSQKSSQSISVSGGFYISKVTPGIKIELSTSGGYSENRLQIYNEDTLFYSSLTAQRSFNSRNLFVKSLGDHFGIGAIGGIRKSDYSNLDLQVSAGLAIEYNIFKYSDATSKQLRFLFGTFFEGSKYNSITTSGRMYDNMYSQEFHTRFMTIKPWGSIYANGFARTYLNDLSQYSFGVDATASINVAKGLYLNISGGASYIRNQLSLPQGQASFEEIYRGDRQLETNYSYHLNVGISFRFGSIFNNHVNPRFSN
jgi:hypothetical protein